MECQKTVFHPIELRKATDHLPQADLSLLTEVAENAVSWERPLRGMMGRVAQHE
jgi:hypothetical protein